MESEKETKNKKLRFQNILKKIVQQSNSIRTDKDQHHRFVGWTQVSLSNALESINEPLWYSLDDTNSKDKGEIQLRLSRNRDEIDENIQECFHQVIFMLFTFPGYANQNIYTFFVNFIAPTTSSNHNGSRV